MNPKQLQVFTRPRQGPRQQLIHHLEEVARREGAGGRERDDFLPGSTLSPRTLEMLSGARDPLISQLEFDYAVKAVERLARRIQRDGLNPEVRGATRDAQRKLGAALNPAVLVHVEDAPLDLLKQAAQRLKTASTKVDLAHKDAGELSDILEQAAVLELPLRPEVQDLVLSLDDQVFDHPLDPEAAGHRLIVDSDVPQNALDELIDAVRLRRKPVQIVDARTEEERHIMRGDTGPVTDDVELAKQAGDRLILSRTGGANVLRSLVEDAQTYELGKVELTLESLDALPDVIKELKDLWPTGNERLPSVTIVDRENRYVGGVRSDGGGVRVRFPEIPTSAYDEAAHLIERILADSQTQTGTFGGVGFERIGTDVVARLPATKDLAQNSEILAPVLSHPVVVALGPGHSADVVDFVRAALDHVRHADSDETADFDGLSPWTAALASLAEYAETEPRKKLLAGTLRLIQRRSESADRPGFGCGLLKGHAKSSNSLAMLRAGTRQSKASAFDHFLIDILDGFEGAADSVVVRGALVDIVADLHFSSDSVRRRSAEHEVRCLRMIREQLRAISKEGDLFEVAVLPTDRTHGQAGTPTPDFRIRRLPAGGFAEHVFADAKMADATRLDANVHPVVSALDQLRNHSFLEGEATDGLILLHFYRADEALRKDLLRWTQNRLRGSAAANQDRPPIWAHIVFDDGRGPARVVLLDPTANFEAQENGSLPDAWGWKA